MTQSHSQTKWTEHRGTGITYGSSTYQLEQVNPTTIAIVDTSQPAGQDTGSSTTDTTNAANPATGANVTSAAAQMANGTQLLAAADTAVSDGQVVGVLSAPVATDATGKLVPTTLSANQATTNTVTLNLDRSGGPYTYPITVDPTGIDIFAAVNAAVNANAPASAPNGFCGNHQLYAWGSGYSSHQKTSVYETSGDARGLHYYYFHLSAYAYECITRFSQVLFNDYLDLRNIYSTDVYAAKPSDLQDGTRCLYRHYIDVGYGVSRNDPCRYEHPHGSPVWDAQPRSFINDCCPQQSQLPWIQWQRRNGLNDGPKVAKLVTAPNDQNNAYDLAWQSGSSSQAWANISYQSAGRK